MTEEKQVQGGETGEQPAKKEKKKVLSKKLLIVIGLVVVLVGGGGAGAFYFLGGQGKKGSAGQKDAAHAVKGVLMPLDPFVVNMSEHGRYLKVTMQLEISDSTNQPLVSEKVPNLRDAIITLLSSKSAESVTGPEGKFQLKDELILRVNQAMGKEVFKNIYFTEFVMQ